MNRRKKDIGFPSAWGMVHYDAQQPCSVEELLDGADALMYAHKLQRGLERETIPSETGGKKQERVCERYETDAGLPAEIGVSGAALVKTISVRGIALRTSQRLTKNVIYKIKIRSTDGKEFSCQALVVWSSLLGKVSENGEGGPYYEAGLTFIEPNDSLMRALEDLIEGKVTLENYCEKSFSPELH